MNENTSFTAGEKALYETSWAVMSYIGSKRMRTVKYRGHGIAPIVAALVRNEDGLIVGRLIAKTRGLPISKLVDAKRLSASQIDSALDQVADQVKILAENRVSHNDLAEENILVSVSKVRAAPGEDTIVNARLIGFSPPLGRARSPADELERSLQWVERIRSRLHFAGSKGRVDAGLTSGVTKI